MCLDHIRLANNRSVFTSTSAYFSSPAAPLLHCLCVENVHKLILFQHLLFQDQHELPVNSNFKKQLEKDMEQAVSKGQMSVADYYIWKQELITANTTGIDDGHSCTKGL